MSRHTAQHAESLLFRTGDQALGELLHNAQNLEAAEIAGPSAEHVRAHAWAMVSRRISQLEGVVHGTQRYVTGFDATIALRTSTDVSALHEQLEPKFAELIKVSLAAWSASHDPELYEVSQVNVRFDYSMLESDDAET